MSFSVGLNCQESVNIASVDWLPHGVRALMQSQKFGRLPQIPIEEMLCKDAILVGRSRTPGIKMAVNNTKKVDTKEFCMNLGSVPGESFA